MAEELESLLVCEECGEHSDEAARGWRTFLTDDNEVSTYCADCAEQEFDE